MRNGGSFPEDQAPNSPEGVTIRRPFEMSGRQLELGEALRDVSPDLHSRYVSALMVLQDERIPDRLALAAHAIRELMDRFPRYTSVDPGALWERLTDQIPKLVSPWERMMCDSTCHTADGSWRGEIDDCTGKMLRVLCEFMHWYQENKRNRKHVMKQVFRELDGSQVQLPASFEEQNVAVWQSAHGYFVGVLHHKASSDLDQFPDQLSRLEVFLLDQLRPRTAADYDEIDLIIKGDSHAEP